MSDYTSEYVATLHQQVEDMRSVVRDLEVALAASQAELAKVCGRLTGALEDAATWRRIHLRDHQREDEGA
jgi:hypothetical protein